MYVYLALKAVTYPVAEILNFTNSVAVHFVSKKYLAACSCTYTGLVGTLRGVKLEIAHDSQTWTHPIATPSFSRCHFYCVASEVFQLDIS